MDEATPYCLKIFYATVADTFSSALRGGASVRRGRLTRPDPEDYYLDCVHQHHEIERQAMVLDVVQVVLQLLPSITLRRSVAEFDLCPTGDPGFHGVPFPIIGDRLV